MINIGPISDTKYKDRVFFNQSFKEDFYNRAFNEAQNADPMCQP